MSVYTKAAFWSMATHMSSVTSMMLRNIIFARFLSPTDFAITLTFGLVLTLFEYISNFGHENFMQRSDAGNSLRFQATMHSMMIARGILVCGCIVLIAPYIPSLLNIEIIEFNYALLAIVPLINSFAHLDHQRLHRRQIYIVTAKIGLRADVSSIIVALICVLLWESYWAFYISFVFRHSFSTVLSHVYARRAYSLAFEHQHVKALLLFGLPLLFVGLLKYVGIEFDKAIVARLTGLDAFSTYVLTLMLLVNGTNIVTLALSKIFIRRVAKDSGGSIANTVSRNGTIHCFLVFPILAMLSGLGEDIIQLIFGQQYTPISFLIVAAASIVGMRSINQWLNQTVIGSAPTKLLLIADLIRVAIALIGVWLIYENGNTIKVIGVFWVSELAYFLALSLLLNKRFSIIATSTKILAIYAVCTAGFFIVYANTFDSGLVVKTLWSTLYAALIAGHFIVISKTCRQQMIAIVAPIKLRFPAN